jgi:thiamine-phosphate pyrophosphorylase
VIPLIGKLCIITDIETQSRYSHCELADLAIKGGADIIQLRDKLMPTAELIDTAIEIRQICRRSNVIFIINDRTDVALISDADGVHLGNEDIPIKEARKLLGSSKIIGGTAHTLPEALRAEKEGADYIGYGHIFHTWSKIKNTKPRGLERLKMVASRINIPVFAIGGIGAENAMKVISTGVHGIAVIGAVAKSPAPDKAAMELRKILYEEKN